MARNWLHVLAAGAALSVACGSSDDNSNSGLYAGSGSSANGASCSPGDVSSCACPDGTQSTQVCSADGVSLSPCQCGGADNSLSSPGTGAAPPTNTGGTATGAGGGAGAAGSATGGSGGAIGGAGGTAGTIGGTDAGVVSAGGTAGSAVGGAAGTEATGGAAGAGGGDPPPPPGDLCLQQGGGDYSAAGPYEVTTKSVDLGGFATLPSTPTTYTIFYPANMEASCPHPIVAWGNGTGVTGSDVYAFFNNNAASWGMVVIASDNSNVGSGDFHRAGIDYMLAQNDDPSSEFYQKLSPRAGTTGHSQGAIGATAATNHPNVEAEVQVEGGGNPKAGIAFLALSGTADNIVTTGPPTQSYGAATGPAFLAIYTGADHVTTPTLGGVVGGDPGTPEFVRLYTAWFRCFLADDSAACSLFQGGQSCGICSNSAWDTLESKNL